MVSGRGGAETNSRPLGVIALTQAGARIGGRLVSGIPGARLFLPARLKAEACRLAGNHVFPVHFFEGPLRGLVLELFPDWDFIFIMAAGIAVRLVAPLLKDKHTDPAVVVVDEKGLHAISLLGGHLAGANGLARRAAAALGAEPVITTATDLQERTAVDLLARDVACEPEPLELVKVFNRRLAEGETIYLYSPRALPFEPAGGVALQDWDRFTAGEGPAAVLVTNRKLSFPGREILFLRPRNLVVGIGCRRGVAADTLWKALLGVFDDHGLTMKSIRALATVDIKSEEAGIVALAGRLGVPLMTVGREQIKSIRGAYDESSFVNMVLGVGGVCEPAAILVSRRGRLLVPKQRLSGATVAVAEDESWW